MSEGLEISDDGGGVIRVRIRRPPDNAFTLDMCHVLSELLASPPAGARLLHLSGEPGVFCRGRDRSGPGSAAARDTVEALGAVTQGLSASSLVTVAEVDGEAAGFGVGLAVQCDITVASTSSRFWFPEATHGLAPALVLSWLPRVVGRHTAFWLAASSESVTAAEAQRLGLITFTAESANLSARVDEVVATLLRNTAAVLQEIKRDLLDFQEVGQGSAYRMATDRLVLSVLTEAETVPGQ